MFALMFEYIVFFVSYSSPLTIISSVKSLHYAMNIHSPQCSLYKQLLHCTYPVRFMFLQNKKWIIRAILVSY